MMTIFFHRRRTGRSQPAGTRIVAMAAASAMACLGGLALLIF
jgi:hypothetical protein